MTQDGTDKRGKVSMPRTIRKLCLKNYPWFIDMCDVEINCSDCELENATIEEGDIPNSVKDALHQLIKLYGSSEEKSTQEI